MKRSEEEIRELSEKIAAELSESIGELAEGDSADLFAIDRPIERAQRKLADIVWKIFDEHRQNKPMLRRKGFFASGNILVKNSDGTISEQYETFSKSEGYWFVGLETLEASIQFTDGAPTAKFRGRYMFVLGSAPETEYLLTANQASQIFSDFAEIVQKVRDEVNKISLVEILQDEQRAQSRNDLPGELNYQLTDEPREVVGSIKHGAWS